MLEILGFMIVTYGVARLVQTSTEDSVYKSWGPVIGVVGIIALIILAVALHTQAEEVGSLLP